MWYYDRCLVLWCRKLLTLRSCSPSLVVDIPSRSAEEDPHGPVYSADHRDSPIAVLQVVDAPVVQVVWFHRLFISVYSALLGSTADTSFVSVYGVFHIYVNWRITDPEVDSGFQACVHYFIAPCIWLSLVRACMRSTRCLLSGR